MVTLFIYYYFILLSVLIQSYNLIQFESFRYLNIFFSIFLFFISYFGLYEGVEMDLKGGKGWMGKRVNYLIYDR